MNNQIYVFSLAPWFGRLEKGSNNAINFKKKLSFDASRPYATGRFDA